MNLIRTTGVLLAGALLSASVLAGTAAAAPLPAETCAQYGTVSLDGGRIIAQNNRWGASTEQCIDASGTGFVVTRADHNNPTNGAPASYPSVYVGCHYGNCTVDSGLPAQVSGLGDPRATYDITTPDAGEWDAAFDIWFDPTPAPPGQNYGAEVMIWADHRGSPQPIGGPVATVTLEGGTWDVWVGNIGWNVISYVRTTPTDGMDDFSIESFVQDAVSRGQIDPAWYLTSVQAGFEPWVGGTGLSVDRFAFHV
jgi:endoglucanase